MPTGFFSLPKFNKQTFPWMTAVLVLANVTMFIIIEVSGDSADTDYMIKMGAAYGPDILENHEYYRLFTHMFLHFGFMHLFNNMISLIVLGYTTERVLGRIRFLVLYLLSGILAGVTSLLYCISVNEATVSAGASGAIFGLLGALLVLLIRGSRGHIGNIFPFLIYLAIALYSGYVDQTIDHAAHLGGFIAGMVICLLMHLGKKKFKI
ncbi:MAG: rhomboid family intramembrane serine protease [Eubacterium sp.]|nr:rhomboid family intramembrane serine protease [Eubacterium sp.]